MSTHLAAAPTPTIAPPPRVKSKKAAAPFPLWCKRTETSLSIEKAKITFEEYQKAFEAADTSGKGHQWWIGDILNAGENLLPDEYSQVLDPEEEASRENEGSDWTYRKYQQVAYRVPYWRRRQSKHLKFGHYQAVAFIESEEVQEYWLDLAESEYLSVDKLRRKIKRAAEGGAEDEPALGLQVLQDPAIRQWLDDYRILASAHDDKLQALIKERPDDLQCARFLHRMTRAHIEQGMRQLDRTLAIDCEIVKRAVGSMLSSSADEIERALRVRGFFMSRADLDDRLKLLVDLGEIRKEKAEDQRVANARGDVVEEYKIVRKPGQPETDDDEEDKRW